MAATYAGLGESQVKPNCESRLAATSTGPGALTSDKGSGGSLRPLLLV